MAADFPSHHIIHQEEKFLDVYNKIPDANHDVIDLHRPLSEHVHRLGGRLEDMNCPCSKLSPRLLYAHLLDIWAVSRDTPHDQRCPFWSSFLITNISHWVSQEGLGIEMLETLPPTQLRKLTEVMYHAGGDTVAVADMLTQLTKEEKAAGRPVFGAEHGVHTIIKTLCFRMLASMDPDTGLHGLVLLLVPRNRKVTDVNSGNTHYLSPMLMLLEDAEMCLIETEVGAHGPQGIQPGVLCAGRIKGKKLGVIQNSEEDDLELTASSDIELEFRCEPDRNHLRERTFVMLHSGTHCDDRTSPDGVPPCHVLSVWEAIFLGTVKNVQEDALFWPRELIYTTDTLRAIMPDYSFHLENLRATPRDVFLESKRRHGERERERREKERVW